MKRTLSIFASILMCLNCLTNCESQVEVATKNQRTKRQSVYEPDPEYILKAFQTLPRKTLNEFPWKVESHREISGFPKEHFCAGLCLMDPNGCNLFQTLASGRCLLSKFRFDSNSGIKPSDIKESVKFIFESFSNTPLNDPRAISVTSERLCVALCLIAENCTYSLVSKESCNILQYNPNMNESKILDIKGTPDSNRLPIVFGYQISETMWVVCHLLRCDLGNRKMSSKTFNKQMWNYKDLFVRNRKSLQPWTAWSLTSFSLTQNGHISYNGAMEKNQVESLWSEWSDWSACSNDCTFLVSSTRTRSCVSESGVDAMKSTCNIGQVETQTRKCDETGSNVIEKVVFRQADMTGIPMAASSIPRSYGIYIYFNDYCGNFCSGFLHDRGYDFGTDVVFNSCNGKKLKDLFVMGVTKWDGFNQWTGEYARVYMKDQSYYECSFLKQSNDIKPTYMNFFHNDFRFIPCKYVSKPTT